MSPSSSVSVLICTYNRHTLLREALESVIIGTEEKPDQVIVVNGGDERADCVVNSFAERSTIEIRLVKTVNRSLAASRNVGLQYCTGDIVAMTDDDAQVFPDWVTQMKRVHAEHPEAGAVGGPVFGMNTDSLVGKVADLITFPTWPDPQYVRTLPGVNISYKRNAVEQVGPQDETLFRGEDVDYNWRVKLHGYEIYFDPKIRVYHFHRPTVQGLLNQHYMYGRAYYLVRQKWPEMYCIYPHRLRYPKDMLKLGNFFADLAYRPFINVRKLLTWSDRLLALPLLFASGIAWRAGIVAQRIRDSG